MQRIKIKSHGRMAKVRHDRRRSKPRLTKSGYLQGSYPDSGEYSGDWKKWWCYGCGTWENGTPLCPAGHSYYLSRYYRAAHRRSKIQGRRIERRKNNRLVDDY